MRNAVSSRVFNEFQNELPFHYFALLSMEMKIYSRYRNRERKGESKKNHKTNSHESLENEKKYFPVFIYHHR